MGKRLSLKVLQELEEKIAQTGGITRSAVFGVCGMDKQVLRSWVLVNGLPEATDEEPTILIPERLERLLWPKRTKLIFGGRGSAKTRTIISILTEQARSEAQRIACFREIQNSISESSYQELVEEINRKGHADYFKVTENRIRALATGSTFSFAGLFRNQTKVKGFANVKRAWVEEAENVSRTSWDILVPTIRAPGSEVWVSFNPREETDPTWADLVAPYWDKAVDGIYEDDNTLIIECNWQHNPWLTNELALERDKMRDRDVDRYMWIWEGKFRRNSDVKVFNGKWRIADFTPAADWDGPYFGADFGFSQDPSTLNKLWIHDGCLYVEYEANGIGVEIEDMPAFYDKVPGSRQHKIWADCARPETISHIKRQGFNIEGAEKWTGSVEDGITFLRSFREIIIHPRCKHTAYEANAYEYKTDRLTGDILPDVVDKDNHHWDAIRYALFKLIKRKGRSYYDF